MQVWKGNIKLFRHRSYYKYIFDSWDAAAFKLLLFAVAYLNNQNILLGREHKLRACIDTSMCYAFLHKIKANLACKIGQLVSSNDFDIVGWFVILQDTKKRIRCLGKKALVQYTNVSAPCPQSLHCEAMPVSELAKPYSTQKRLAQG